MNIQSTRIVINVKARKVIFKEHQTFLRKLQFQNK
jgi:hypothetical protein